jgi:hypothetical protein
LLAQFILNLAILLFFYKPANFDINKIIPKPVSVLSHREDFETTLAVPPIHLSGPIPNDGRKEIQVVYIDSKKFTVSFDGNRVSIRNDTEPSYPFIIEAPGQKFWIKISKERRWLSIEAFEGDIEFLNALIQQFMGKGPPPPEGNDGNGNGHNWYDPPFKSGDLAVYLPRESLGSLLVSDIWLRYLPEIKQFVWWVVAVHRIQGGGGFEEIVDFAVNFKKAPEGLNSAQQFEGGK